MNVGPHKVHRVEDQAGSQTPVHIFSLLSYPYFSISWLLPLPWSIKGDMWATHKVDGARHCNEWTHGYYASILKNYTTKRILLKMKHSCHGFVKRHVGTAWHLTFFSINSILLKFLNWILFLYTEIYYVGPDQKRNWRNKKTLFGCRLNMGMYYLPDCHTQHTW